MTAADPSNALSATVRQWMLRHPRQVLLCMALLSVAVGAAAYFWNRSFAEQKQVELLQTDAQRRGVELLSQTLNGNLMGSVSLLGVIHAAIKQEALGATQANDLSVKVVLGLLGGTYKANGIFVVGEDGMVKSSWNRDGGSSSGTDVRFRPYYQLAMKGRQSVYAAISVSSGERSLYFSAPVFSEMAVGNSGIGAVVARHDLSRVEDVLKASADLALLMTPQGVVFAASDSRWIGQAAGVMTEERLQDIRGRKQMGKMFDLQPPVALPLGLDAPIQKLGADRYAVATSPVEWNDPGGPWTLVMANHLERDGLNRDALAVGATGIVLALLFQYLLLWLLQSQWRQQVVAQELAASLQAQQEQVQLRHSLAEMATHLQRCDSLGELARTYLSEMHGRAGSLQGMVFHVDVEDPHTLRYLAGYATPDGQAANVQVGDGLLGQAVQDQELRWLGSGDATAWTLRSGLGATTAVTAVVAPLMANDEVVGAVELAFMQGLRAEQMEWVNESLGLLALNLAVQRRAMRSAVAHVKDESS